MTKASASFLLEESVPVLMRNPLLGQFRAEDWRLFVHYLRVVEFEAGTMIVAEGDEGHDMYFILEGEAALSRDTLDLGTLGPGEHFGELALISHRVRAASVSARTKMWAARLSRNQFDTMCEDAPYVALRFVQALLSSVGARLTEMTDSVGLLLRERSLPRHTQVAVRVGDLTQQVRTGTPVSVVLSGIPSTTPVVAGLVNNKAVSLSTPIASDATVEPLSTSHWEGKRIYRQSLGLLVLEAASRVTPDVPVCLGPSFGFGQRLDVRGALMRDTDVWITDVTREMKRIIASDAAFRQELWTVEEARSHFEETGWPEAALLLQATRDSTVALVSCGNVAAFGIGPCVPSAGVFTQFPFRLKARGSNLIVIYGDEDEVPGAVGLEEGEIGAQVSLSSGPDSAPPSSRSMIAPEEEPWLSTLGVTSVGAFNEACVQGNVSQIIRVSEGLHEKRIAQIADAIASRYGQVRVICIAGPSSSGKTTFIKRLTVQLQVNGIHPVGISIDDYYLDRDKTAKDAQGNYDFEALEALDLKLLNEHLGRLLSGERVKTARYDFMLGQSLPSGGPSIQLKRSDTLLLEGIHGLNPALVSAVADRSQVFRIFVQPSTSLPFDRLSRVNVSDVRLLRRIVRDRHQRATNAKANIMRWPLVRVGERQHIFPFLDQADAHFDSALVYEISVIKVFADRYLLEVPSDHPSFTTAHRLRQLIDRFITIYPDHVPPTSILREFIGGSGFEY